MTNAHPERLDYMPPLLVRSKGLDLLRRKYPHKYKEWLKAVRIVPPSHWKKVKQVVFQDRFNLSISEDVVGGSYDKFKEIIYLYRPFDSYRAVIHELGHAIYNSDKGVNIDQLVDNLDDLFLKAHATGIGFPTTYARKKRRNIYTWVSEFAAESYTLHLLRPVELHKINPKLSIVMEKIFRALDQR